MRSQDSQETDLAEGEAEGWWGISKTGQEKD